MTRSAWALSMLLAVASCGDGAAPITASDLTVRVRFAKNTVAPGEGVAVEVVRVWNKSLDPSPWDDAMLSPLSVRTVSVTRREDAQRVEEARRLHAYAFTRKDVAIPAIPFAGRPADGGDLKVAATRPLVLRVRPEVEAAAPGPPELPEPLPAPALPWLLLALLVGAATLAIAARWGLEAAPAPAASPIPGLADAGRDPAAVAHAIRAFVSARCGVPALLRTTEETLAALPREAGALAAVLGPCDRAKFARENLSDADVDAVVEAARSWLEARS